MKCESLLSPFKERPILFNGEMIRAILEGRKTQTRRVIKPQPDFYVESCYPAGTENPPIWWDFWGEDINKRIKCPYVSSNRLWVRETWYRQFGGSEIVYRADGEQGIHKWDSPLFMLRKFSRITLEITGVRVERVQDISEDDCDKEIFGGDFPHNVIPDYGFHGGMSIQECFAVIWDFLNAKRGYGWNVNPWVWVIEFKRVET